MMHICIDVIVEREDHGMWRWCVDEELTSGPAGWAEGHTPTPGAALHAAREAMLAMFSRAATDV